MSINDLLIDYTGAQAQQECEELIKQLEGAGIGGAQAAGDADGKLNGGPGGGSQIWIGRGCAAGCLGSIPMFRGNFSKNRYHV